MMIQILIKYSPDINSRGDVVWYGYDASTYNYEIYIYEASTGVTRQLSLNPDYDYNPKIGDNGNVVWFGWDNASYSYVVFLYDYANDYVSHVSVGNLSGEDDNLEINANGDFVGTAWSY